MQISQPGFRRLEEANEVSAARLIDERRFAKVGDIFRWGRLIKKSKFFGLDALLIWSTSTKQSVPNGLPAALPTPRYLRLLINRMRPTSRVAVWSLSQCTLVSDPYQVPI
jgi:hypothetical protein